jgi:hypothetical protein
MLKLAKEGRSLNVINNMIRYSELEAEGGAYLSAILALGQTLNDIARGVEGGEIGEGVARELTGRVSQMREEYLRSSKRASPKIYKYKGAE